MARKGMRINQLNTLMNRIKNTPQVRYVSPVIHARVGYITAFNIWTADDYKEFTITNNPDENFDLYQSVNDYLDTLTYWQITE